MTLPLSETPNAILEEDWSDIMTADNLSGRFTQHEIQDFNLANGTSLQIASVTDLTPLDMIDLSWGTHDATGHKIWTGARFFLQILTPTLESYFSKKEIIELGSGTGLSGISVSKVFRIKRMLLTDASISALELCQLNCTKNKVTMNTVKVEKLCWGEPTLPSLSLAFDTVLATDVIYDIKAWDLLLKTAYTSLKDQGIFVLSHVPRAALPEGSEEELESYLVKIALRNHNFCLVETHRPQDFVGTLQGWSDMEQAGAAVFVFQKLQHPHTLFMA
jgi:predicted nicotinamide N-methyase